jgi:hypothetical protein
MGACISKREKEIMVIPIPEKEEPCIVVIQEEPHSATSFIEVSSTDNSDSLP